MIQVYQSRKELSFRVAGELFQQVKQWTYSIDEKVFNNQLDTGRFRGRELDQDILEVMRRVKVDGGVMPYYGVGGSSGVCSYQFYLMPTQAKLTLVHQETKETTEFFASYTILDFGLF